MTAAKIITKAISSFESHKTNSYPSKSIVPERLQSLNLPSLSYRRNRMDLIMAYKILNDLVVVDKDYFLQLIPAVLLEQMD